MPASLPVTESVLLEGVIRACGLFAVLALAVWCGVFLVRLQRLRRGRREAEAEKELTGSVLDLISGYDHGGALATLNALPPWRRRVLLRVLCGLIEQTKGQDQAQLIELLRTTGFHERALADLRARLPVIRQQACTVLGYFHDEPSVAGVRSVLADPDPAVRLTAAQALLRHDRLASVRELLESLDLPRDDPPLILGEILSQLPARLHGEAVELLRAPLPPEWLHMLALAVARMQVLAAYDALADLRASPSPRIRAAAWIALGELGDPRAGDIVAEGLADPAPDVRQAACACAGRLGSPEVVPRLAALLRDDDWWTAFRAARALLANGPEGRAALAAHAAAAPVGDAGRQALREHEEGIRAA